MRHPIRYLIVLAACCATLLAPSIALAASSCPATVGGASPATAPAARPAGSALTAGQAIAAAQASPRVRALVNAQQAGRPTAAWLPAGCWQVQYFHGSQVEVKAVVDPRSGEIEEAWGGVAASFVLARGEASQFLGVFAQPYFWLGLTALFFFSFFDFRRPFRLAHLDLLALCGFTLSDLLLNHLGLITPAILVTAVIFVYLAARLAWMALKRRGPELYPSIPLPWLAVLLFLLVGARAAMQLTLPALLDVGPASLIGAHLLDHGQRLYGNAVWGARTVVHGDTYGPFAYLSYIPFDLLFPTGAPSGLGGVFSLVGVPVAVAALFFDSLTMIGLACLGWRLGGQSKRGLALVLPFAWAAFPYSTLSLMMSCNDLLIACLLVWLFVFLDRPIVRGVLATCAAATKFLPAVLFPLLAGGPGSRRERRSVGKFVLAALITGAVLAIPVLSDGLGAFYKETFTFQQERMSVFTVWSLIPTGLVSPLRYALALALLVAGTLLFWRPKRRTHHQMVVLCGALLLAIELLPTYWWFNYVPWALPAVFAALLTTPPKRPDRATAHPDRAKDELQELSPLQRWLPLMACAVSAFAVFQLIRDARFATISHFPETAGAGALSTLALIVCLRSRQALKDCRAWQLDLAGTLGLVISAFALTVGAVFAVNGQQIGLLNAFGPAFTMGDFSHAHASAYLVATGIALTPVCLSLVLARTRRLASQADHADDTTPSPS